METDWNLIFSYGTQMTVTFLIGLAIYSVRVHFTQNDLTAWIAVNMHRILVAFGLFWLMSTALVIVPNVAQILGAFGFNADQSAAGIAIVIVGLLVGGHQPELPKEEGTNNV